MVESWDRFAGRDLYGGRPWGRRGDRIGLGNPATRSWWKPRTHG